jgi:hypothetical protein
VSPADAAHSSLNTSSGSPSSCKNLLATICKHKVSLKIQDIHKNDTCNYIIRMSRCCIKWRHCFKILDFSLLYSSQLISTENSHVMYRLSSKDLIRCLLNTKLLTQSYKWDNILNPTHSTPFRRGKWSVIRGWWSMRHFWKYVGDTLALLKALITTPACYRTSHEL